MYSAFRLEVNHKSLNIHQLYQAVHKIRHIQLLSRWQKIIFPLSIKTKICRILNSFGMEVLMWFFLNRHITSKCTKIMFLDDFILYHICMLGSKNILRCFYIAKYFYNFQKPREIIFLLWLIMLQWKENRVYADYFMKSKLVVLILW